MNEGMNGGIQLEYLIHLGLLLLKSLQGVRPQSFEKVENAEIRDIIDCCTKLRKDERCVAMDRSCQEPRWAASKLHRYMDAFL